MSHLRLKCTKFESRRLSVCLSVCPSVRQTEFDTAILSSTLSCPVSDVILTQVDHSCGAGAIQAAPLVLVWNNHCCCER